MIKKNVVGPVLKSEGLMKLAIEGMQNKRSKGRPRIDMLDEVLEGGTLATRRVVNEFDSVKVKLVLHLSF